MTDVGSAPVAPNVLVWLATTLAHGVKQLACWHSLRRTAACASSDVPPAGGQAAAAIHNVMAGPETNLREYGATGEAALAALVRTTAGPRAGAVNINIQDVEASRG